MTAVRRYFYSPLESPSLRANSDMSCMQPALHASLKIARDLQLFEKWHEQGDGLVGCQSGLLVRILRHLEANYVLEQVSADTFKPSRFSLALLQPEVGEWITFLYDATIPCFHKAPWYLESTNYTNPSDLNNCIFQSAKGGFKGDFFQYYTENPREGAAFNTIMGSVVAAQTNWLDIIPVQEHILADADPDPSSPLIVDVGGNIGHDMEKVRLAFPDLASRFYLQDLPAVIARAKCPDPVHKIAHDFFQPQSVHGARVYYLHGVLHDWPDETAKQILLMLKGAMKCGYSKLLIHDHVIPEADVHPYTTSFDLGMMVLFAGKERTERKWRALLLSAGYSFVRIWRSPLAVQAIVEVELTE
ncbi:S-adenosyl-L-methionine-dependent methyltransferase [Aspergillus crustosus]